MKLTEKYWPKFLKPGQYNEKNCQNKATHKMYLCDFLKAEN